MPALDPRLTPARRDLAALHLEGQVEAPRFVEGRLARVVWSSAPLRRQPEAAASLDTEALHGEAVVVYDQADGWSWVQLERDAYVGYLPSAALGAARAPTHRVVVPRTHVYPGSSIKRPPLMAISLGALVSIAHGEGDFLIDEDGRRLFARHCEMIDCVEPDFVAVAERFLHCPYLWGGRTSEGLDCSGLAQTALTAAGIASPRDSDMMEAELGRAMEEGAPKRRGDLVFWKGHVGVMQDEARLLHANGFHMGVVSEPFAEAVARIAATGGGGVTCVRRLG